MNTEATNAFWGQIPLFESTTVEERSYLSEVATVDVRPKYSFIYMPGDASEAIYFLAKGTVKIGTHSIDGREVIKSLIHPTAMFGEMVLIGETQRQEFAQALKEDVVVYTVKVEDLKKLMRQNFELCNNIMGLFGNRLIKAENKLESLIFKDARTRIVDFIKESVCNRGRRVGYEMLLKHSLTHQDIANITCTSRQTVTLVLNELRKSDLIYFNRGKILVRDIARLA